jgi:hypothetical protein
MDANDYIWKNFIELIYEDFTHHPCWSVPYIGSSLRTAAEQ